jgi:LemA protein
MTPMALSIIGAAVVLVIGAMFVVAVYNRLVTLRNRHLNAFSQIDVQLKRRHDLIPNLVEAVKGYMAHERETLEAVIAARSSAVSAMSAAAANPASIMAIQGLAGAENALTATLGRLLMLREAYPQLKADQNVSRLMEELTSTENRVGFARQAYNDAVMVYNTARQVFPNSLIAGAFGFHPAELFQIEFPHERAPVAVSF